MLSGKPKEKSHYSRGIQSDSAKGCSLPEPDGKAYCAECFCELSFRQCIVKLVLNPSQVSKKSCTCLQFYTLQGLILGTDGTRLISFEGWHWRDDCFLCSTCVGTLCDYGLVTSSDATAIICSNCNEKKTKPKSILKKPQQNQSQGYSSGVIDSGIEVLEENSERVQPVQKSKLTWLIQVND